MTTIDPDVVDLAPNGTPDAAADGGWRVDKQGRRYIPRVGARGILYQQANETPEEALAAAAKPKDERPRKTRKPKQPPPSKKADLRELEPMLVEAFRSPAPLCAMVGDEWGANHFTNMGPFLARNLVRAAETNPWLRSKLEEAATGGEMMMKLAGMAGLTSAVVMYVAPPLIYWLNLPAPDRAREMFGIPDRKPTSAPSPPPPAAAAAPPGA